MAGPGLLDHELALAARGGIYLVVHPGEPVLEIKARGMTLGGVALDRVTVLCYRSVRTGPRAETFELPRVWTVTRGAPSTFRRMVAPSGLRPWTADAEPAGAMAAATPPADYAVGLDGGWQLRVGEKPPATALWSRLGSALGDGWARLWGRQRATPDLLVLTLPAEGARALHHLLRPGTSLILAPDGSPASSSRSPAAGTSADHRPGG